MSFNRISPIARQVRASISHLVAFVSMIALLGAGGCGTPSFLITPVSNTNELQETTVASGKHWIGGGKIALLEVEGTLMDVRSGGFMQPQENPLSLFVQQLDQAAMDNSVKAIVLRVNSPGGSVTTSDTMYEALREFKSRTHKPVVAAIQEVGASGAYYVCCGADKIVATPTSLVGSIGVIFEGFDLVEALKKLGIRPDTYKSAEEKDMGSPFKQPTDADKQIIQGIVNEDYARFKAVVSQNRPVKQDESFSRVTDGRVFNGTDAMQLGLIDQTGRLEDAIDLARQMSGAAGASVVMYKRPYGYAGSIYASSHIAAPSSAMGDHELTLRLPDMGSMVPAGFYYLWQP